jgi:hypothetical protein
MKTPNSVSSEPGAGQIWQRYIDALFHLEHRAMEVSLYLRWDYQAGKLFLLEQADDVIGSQNPLNVIN